MIQATIFKNQDDQFMGFECLGHAGYAEMGKDIVCAGVSTLVFNTVDSIECYTDQKFYIDTDEDTGKIIMYFFKPAEHDAELLMKSLVLGLQFIQYNYGDEYITLNFKEV